LLNRHQGRNDQVTETSLNAGQVDAQMQSPKTSPKAASPATSPTIKPFLGLGYIACSIRRTTRITDRRRKRALAANPASKKPGASKLKRGAAVRVHALVVQQTAYLLAPLRSAAIHPLSLASIIWVTTVQQRARPCPNSSLQSTANPLSNPTLATYSDKENRRPSLCREQLP
jgi:hypothetical protein